MKTSKCMLLSCIDECDLLFGRRGAQRKLTAIAPTPYAAGLKYLLLSCLWPAHLIMPR